MNIKKGVFRIKILLSFFAFFYVLCLCVCLPINDLLFLMLWPCVAAFLTFGILSLIYSCVQWVVLGFKTPKPHADKDNPSVL